MKRAGRVLRPDEVIRWAGSKLSGGEPVCIATVILKRGSAAVDEGWMISVTEREVVGNMGGGSIEERVIAACLEALKSGKPRILKFWLKATDPPEGYIKTDLVCGGEVHVHLNPVFPPRRVHIIGGGHVGKAIADLANFLGYEVFVYEDNREIATRERFPYAKEIFVGKFEEVLLKLKPNPSDIVILAYGDKEHDEKAVRRMAEVDAAYKGWLSSRSKAGLIRGELQREGVPKEALDSIRAPMGLDIGARRPEEIAVAVFAEVISVLTRTPPSRP